MVKITDLVGHIDPQRMSDISKAAEKALEHQRAVDRAFGSTGRDMMANAERYRAILGPSEDVRKSIAEFAASGLAAKAQMESLRQTAASFAASPAVAEYLKNHIRVTEAYAPSSEAMKYIREQLQEFRTNRYGLLAGDYAALREIDRSRFAVPASAVLSAQLKGIDPAQFYPTSRLLGLDQERMLQAAGALRSPWMEAADGVASITRFAELQSIGKAVRLETAYSDEVSSALRDSLGDYRDAVTTAPEALQDLDVRTELYLDRGLDRELTDLPEEAFEETLDVTDIRGEPPPLVTIYGTPIRADEDEQVEAGFRRNNQAHDWLQRFETGIRGFIDGRMTAQFGDEWPRKRLPNDMLDRWLEKQNKDPNRDRQTKIIVYADFTDYELIICKRDNFREVFAPFFNREEHFRESMRRLSIPRIEVMHARFITQDDELFVYSEIRRLTNQFLRRH